MNAATSLSLLCRVRQGRDAEAWERFVRLYDTVIRNWLSRQNVPSQDADDVIQEVMSLLVHEISRFQHNGRRGAFRHWLRMITVNRLREFWRKRRHGAAGPNLDQLASQLADNHSGVSRIWREEHDRCVLNHLLRLAADQFHERSLQAFRRVVLEQQSPQQVAQELEMSVGAVRVAQSRVLRALRRLGEGLID